MSWPLASFLIVGSVLAAGWLAYERRRPSAKMVAVVATLSAVAALGRDAFVALPDVKPITAIAFVVGYALGPLPGFTVGAIGMLASNAMLGQGPYTPWQMAAWGLVGLAGAALGRLTGRRLPRVPLALACALAALFAKEIMNLYEWTIGASHTPAAFLVISVSSLPYDIADVLATFAFAFAFGPELARLLGRTRARMTVRWEPLPPGPSGSSPSTSESPRPGLLASGPSALVCLILMLVCVALVLPGAPARAASTMPAFAGPQPAVGIASLSPELAYLVSAQNQDGGYGAGRGGGSSELYTAWAAMGLAAAGRDPAGVRRGGHSALDSLRSGASTLSGLGDAERTVLAVHACGASPYSFPGRNLIAEVLRARARDGSFEDQVNLTAFAVFALRAAGHSPAFRPIREAAGWIERQQNQDGGFSFGAGGSPSDVDDTGAALQALADAGARNRGALGAAAGYIVRSQNPDGGLPQQYGGPSNAQSTAWAVQGLIAAGDNPAKVSRRGSRSPVGYLESLMESDGAVRYSRTSAQTPVWVTAQALLALAGKTFPVGP
ncbi:MAG TPA: prenyltransferase/squalene oxidase repeat-containing protein [Solirubrobacteraceae bacterium]|nr:prenyltransferase/squalene oxidase repeat-containing protein [Solirubrobacteraceae bacterium]